MTGASRIRVGSAVAAVVAFVACGGLVADPFDGGLDGGSNDALSSADVGMADACSPAAIVATTIDVSQMPSLPALEGDAAVGVSDPSFMPHGTSMFMTLLDARKPGTVVLSDGGVGPIYPLPSPGSSPCDAAPCDGTAYVSPTALLMPGPGNPGEAFMVIGEWYPFVAKDQPPEHFELGAITVGLGPTPTFAYPNRGLHWSSETDSPAKFDIRSLPELADCTSFGHPGPWGPEPNPVDSLDLALTCRTKTGSRIVLLHSADRAKTFTFVANLLTEADGAALGGVSGALDGPQIFEDANGTRYLNVGTRTKPFGPYDGCTTVLLGKSEVVRKCGKPVVIRRIVEKSALPLGSCTFSTAMGYAAAVVLPPSASPRARIFLLGFTSP